MSKTSTQTEWSVKISKFKKSGKTKEEWCRENNISTRQFNYWFRQETENFQAENTAQQWLPVEIKQDEISTGSSLSVKIGMATVEVNPGFNGELLLEVLKILKSL